MHNGDNMEFYNEWKRKEKKKEGKKGRIAREREGRRKENLLKKYFSFQRKPSFIYN